MTTADATKNNTAEAVRAAQDAVRRYTDESAAIGHIYFNAWATTSLAALRSSFEFQNAGMQATRAMWDSAIQTQRHWSDQTVESMRKGQDATSRLWSASFDLLEAIMPSNRS